MRTLALLLSLGLHGAFASLFLLTRQEEVVEHPVVVAVEWEVPRVRGETVKRSSSQKKIPLTRPSPLSRGLDLSHAPKGRHPRISLRHSRGGGNPETLFVKPSWVPASAGMTPLRGVEKGAQKTYHPLPKYPWICRKRGQEGQVSLCVQTDCEGRVVQATLHQSSGYEPLDRAALTAVKEWVFSGHAKQKILTISFRLEGEVVSNK